MLRFLQIGSVKPVGFPAQGLGLGCVGGGSLRDGLHDAAEVGLGLLQNSNSSPAQARHQHPEVFPLRMQHLLHRRHGADGIQLLLCGVVVLQILLWDEKNGLIPLHGRFQRHGRLGASHVKMNGLPRKNRQSAQRQKRHLPGGQRFAHRILLSLWYKKRGSVLPPSERLVMRRSKPASAGGPDPEQWRPHRR